MQPDLNFFLTNRIPRAAATRFMGWFSQIRIPWLVSMSLWFWKKFLGLDLSEAKYQVFESIHECFTRELKPGSRPIDMRDHVLSSPCDGILGQTGLVEEGQLFQAKGCPYSLSDLLVSPKLVETWQGSRYVTIRITSSMYHRFHAPYDGRMHELHYISGDTWNVNPPALARIPSLFCKNERAIIQTSIGPEQMPLLLVPVAAILVASMRIHALGASLNASLPGSFQTEVSTSFMKGEELGWFEHGSTILVFVPSVCQLANGLAEGSSLRMGQALFHSPLI